MSMFGHNPFSWVDLRAETILRVFKSEGWRSIPDSLDTAPAGYDDDTHEDNGWTADPCEASFFLWKGTGDQIGIAYPISSNYNTGTWWIPPAVSVEGYSPQGSPSAGVQGGATSMVVNGYQAGENHIDAYTRVLMIVGNHWDGDTDEGFEANYSNEVSVEAIPTITTIARPAFGPAKWTWISSVSDLPTDCGIDNTTENCGYSNWSEWSDCDKVRETEKDWEEDGTQTRTRTVTSGSNCDGELTQTQDCVSPKPCQWGEWSEWVYDNSPNTMHSQSGMSGCGVWDGDTESFPSSLTRTRTRQVIRGPQGMSYEEGCPDRDSFVGPNGLTQYTNTQTETETVYCPSSENSNCPNGEEIRWRWGPTDATNADGSRTKGWYCDGCRTVTDPNATQDGDGCRTGCKSGYEEVKPPPSYLPECHIVGCTDPTANNYDANATLACNSSSIGTKWKVGAAGLDGNANANKCCEYDCDNPLLKTDWNGQCKDECIDGYEMDSAGNCIEQCNEGFELIDGECKKSPKKEEKDEKKKITTQSDDVSAIEPVKTDNKMPLVVGGIAVLGLLGTFMMAKKK